jgi:trk system potassium uptake protein TrkH
MGHDHWGLIGIVTRIAIFTIVIEIVGAVIIYFRWSTAGVTDVSLWTAVFHSISAFNNCGMDLFGSFNSMSLFGEIQ